MLIVRLALLGMLFLPSLSFACYSQCSAQCGGSSDTSCIPMCMSSCQSTSDGGTQSGGSAVTQYGAIAFSQGTMNYGFSYNKGSRRVAETVAMEYCAKAPDNPKDCKVATWFYNHCAALALKPSAPGKANGAWAAEHASSLRVAKKNALNSCRKYAGQDVNQCKVVESFCARQ